jgi:uncharacterized protein
MTSKLKYFTLFLFLITLTVKVSSQEIPAPPEPPRLVNDFVGLLAAGEAESLEAKLVGFDDATSTQIVVVIVKDLGNYDANQFAFEIGRKWGIGQKSKKNGLVVLVKPKTADSRGQAAIAVGYGLEDTVTDALCKRIVEKEMIPRFKQNDYAGGIYAAVGVLMDVTKGKYTADQYSKRKNSKSSKFSGFLIFCFIILIVLMIVGRRKNDGNTIGGSGSNIPFWLLMGGILGSSGRSSGSGWGDFSSGEGSFGGFGGGDFGGGGASGSW